MAAVPVVISLGAVLGKLNPFQLLVMSLVEAAIFVFNFHIGFKLLGAIDTGK